MNRTFSFAVVSAVLALSSVACAVDPGEVADLESQDSVGQSESAVVRGPGDITADPDVTRCGGSCKVGTDCDGFAKKCSDQGAGCGTKEVGHPAVGSWLQCVSIPPKPSGAQVGTIDDITAPTRGTEAKGCCNKNETTGGLTGCNKPYYPGGGAGATCVGKMVKASCDRNYSNCSEGW